MSKFSDEDDIKLWDSQSVIPPSLSHTARAFRFARRSRSSIAPLVRVFCEACDVRKIRSFAIRKICHLEGGQMWSQTFRELMREHHQVEIGLHSYGSCLWPGRVPRGTRVGNYCSIADGMVALRRNHTVDRASQHPLFYNSSLGLADAGLISEYSDNPLTIGHDVWIGLNVLITPSCKNIGNSAIIAAGSVVTKDVPAYAIVGGVPAKLIQWRFPESVQEALTLSQWWLKPIWELTDDFKLFTQSTSIEIATALVKSTNPTAERNASHKTG